MPQTKNKQHCLGTVRYCFLGAIFVSASWCLCLSSANSITTFSILPPVNLAPAFLLFAYRTCITSYIKTFVKGITEFSSYDEFDFHLPFRRLCITCKCLLPHIFLALVTNPFSPMYYKRIFFVPP